MNSKWLAQCRWPELAEKYDLALRGAVDFILENYNVLGIVASGTIIRGNPSPSSDLDIYVIHEKPYRQRLQRFFNDVPTEIFVNPPQAVEAYFEEEQTARRPITAHMLATGFVIIDNDPIIGELQKKAGGLLLQPPKAPKDLTSQRYFAALLFEDAMDVFESDPDTAMMIAYHAVGAMLNFRFLQAGHFLPRAKSLLAELARLDASMAELARGFYQATSPERKMEIAGDIADKTLGSRGFFEWAAPPEAVSE